MNYKLFLPLLLLSLSAEAQPLATADSVAGWQMSHIRFSERNRHDYGVNSWVNAVFYRGLARWAAQAPDSARYFAWLRNTGERAHWRIADNLRRAPSCLFYHADELCAASFYLDMYARYRQPDMLASTRLRLDSIAAFPPDTAMSHRSKRSWTWCDALFMAPPAFYRAAQLLRADTLARFADAQVMRTYRHLYDTAEHLFFRDDSYFARREANGRKVFWGRGNGWVMAALADILRLLPPSAPMRPFYENLMRQMAESLTERQGADGAWHASLLDPASYPSPEASATALIAYGLAYGINSGILSRPRYEHHVRSAWQWLCSAVQPGGKLGYTQPIGADPKKVKPDDTAPYGAGAFLLLAAELRVAQ